MSTLGELVAKWREKAEYYHVLAGAANNPYENGYLNGKASCYESRADELAAALVAEGQGDAWLDPKSLGIPLQHESSAATPSLHKEELPASMQLICPVCKKVAGEGEYVGIVGCSTCNPVRFTPAALHKEGAVGEPPVVCNVCHALLEIADGEHVCGLTAAEAYSLGWRRGNNAATSPPLPLQRTLPDEQFKGVVVERMLKIGKRALTEEERELVVEAIETPAERLREALELYLRTYADTQTHPTVIEEANCINVARAALASPAGRAEQATKETK